MAYKFNSKTPVHVIECRDEFGKVVKNDAGVVKTKEVKGIHPFGPQNALITDSELTDNMVSYLLGKEEFKDFIEEAKDKTNKNEK